MYLDNYRTARRKQLLELAGGKCKICEYSKYNGALQFHHIKPETKEFDLSKRNLSKSQKRLEVEVDKCILVCANCHAEIHAGLIKI